MEDIPIITVIVLAGVGLCLMLAAFVLVARRGSWQQAMQLDALGQWPLPRKLMVAGAGLGCLFSVLMFLPGMVPWWHYSWGHGVVFGFFLGIIFSWLIFQITRQRTRIH
jgi:hypothetical protein